MIIHAKGKLNINEQHIDNEGNLYVDLNIKGKTI